VEAAEGWVKEIRMKKPESEIRSASLHAKIRPRFKKMAEKMARDDDRSLAQWLEKLIQAEYERRAAKQT
jgi:predicted HicB family RNase H-like nuclease